MKHQRNAPLIVDSGMRRFWALIDPKDGTLYARSLSADFSPRKGENGAGEWSHWDIPLFASLAVARRAAAEELRELYEHVASELGISVRSLRRRVSARLWLVPIEVRVTAVPRRARTTPAR